MARTRFCVVCSLLVSLVTAPAGAQVIAYDGFEYPLGSLEQRGGGVGWGGPWFTTLASQVIAGLPYPSLLTTGNAVNVVSEGPSISRTMLRSLAGPVTMVQGQDVWVSLLAVAPRGVGYAGAFLEVPGGGGLGFVETDFFTGSWLVAGQRTVRTSGVSAAPPTRLNLLVARFRVESPGAATASHLVNPIPGLAAPDGVPAVGTFNVTSTTFTGEQIEVPLRGPFVRP